MKNGFGGRIKFDFLLPRVCFRVRPIIVELPPLLQPYGIRFRKQSVHSETKNGTVGLFLSEEKFQA